MARGGKGAPRAEVFDWDNPEPGYALIWQQRAERLQIIRSTPGMQAALEVYYRDNPWDFISDWGVTYDPRRVDLGLEPIVPFILFEKQVDWLKYAVRKWKERSPALTEKSRDGGLSWLSVALGATLCLFHGGMAVGYGSRTEDYVDKIGEPKSLFWKARLFLTELPREFKYGWDQNRHAPHLRILFPHNGSVMKGESGDNIGRGDRTSIYFIDESAFLEKPKLVDAALSQTTNARHDISTPHGIGNSFYHRAHSGKVEKFTLHWRDDPRKNEAWYQKQVEDIDDPVIVAQELDINYAASVTGVVIPHEWVLAAVDAHTKIGLVPSGERAGGLDVADEGKDKNAFCAAHGVLLTDLQEWSGKGADIFDTVEQAFIMSDRNECVGFRYDADGLGAGVRGDARIINAARKAEQVREIDVTPFRGSAGVFEPEGQDVKGRKNKDYFKNLKAQGWWSLRLRFRNTFRLIKQNKPCSHDDIICIPSTLPHCTRLISELSQPTYAQDNLGKMVINKQPDGTKSPNLADCVMIKFARVERAPMKISDDVLQAAAKMRRARR